MNAEIKALVERRVLAPGHLWMIGVPLDEVVGPEPVAGPADDHGQVDDRAAGECRCPDHCGRDHPNE